MKNAILILCAVLLSVTAWAQNLTVKGRVLSAMDNEPLIGATVMVKGSANGAVTDIDGYYTLNNVPSKGTITFSYVGFVTEDVKVNGQTKIGISMKETENSLDELVVVGYGAVKRSDLTSSISTVKGDEITEVVTGNAMDALQGKVSGVQIASAGGPGAPPKVIIRGITSVNGYWDKLNLRLNTEYNFTDWLKVGLDLAPNMENWDDTPNLFGAAQSMDPTTPVFRPEDQWDLENPMNNYQRSYNNQEWNPAGNLARMDSKTRKFQLLANPFIEIRPIKQLILRTQFGLNFWMQRNDWYNCAFHIADLEKRDKDEVGRKYSDGLNWTWNNTITYTDTYADKHNLTVMAGCRNGVGDGWSWGQPTSDLENAYIAAGDTERLRWTIIKTGCTEIAGEDQFNKFIENNLTKDSYQGGVDNSEFQDCKKLFGWTDDYITTRYLIKPSQHKSARIIRKYFVPLAQRPEVYNICKIPLNHRILRFADVLLMYAEAAAWNYLYEYDNNNRGRTNQIQELFDPASENYIGDLGSVDKVVAGHSYWSFDNWKSMRDVRKRVSDAASAKNLRVWQTEWSMLDKEPSELGGTYDNVSEFDIAQYMSRVIHNDIVMAGCTSWCYWTAMSVERYSQKNRFELIKTTPAGGNYSNDFTSAGNVDATHNLWVLGNYSRFIRPGYIRIGLRANEDKDFFGTAYVSPDGKTVVAVYTNYDKEKGVTLTNSFDNGKTPKTVTRYTTTATRHLEEDRFNVADNVFLEPASVTTVVYTFE